MSQLLIKLEQPTTDGRTKKSFVVGDQSDLDQYELIDEIKVLSVEPYTEEKAKPNPKNTKPGKALFKVKEPKFTVDDTEDSPDGKEGAR